MRHIIRISFWYLIFLAGGLYLFTNISVANAGEVQKADYSSVSKEQLTKLAMEGNYEASIVLTKKFYGDKSFDELLELAEGGDAHAQFLVGSKYKTGEVVEADIIEAEKWYLKASEQGHSTAQHNLANIYFKGSMNSDGSGVSKNVEKGLELLEMSVQKGNPYAMNSLGSFNMMGLYVPQDVQKAVMLHEKAAEKGNVFSANALGSFYNEGFFLKDGQAIPRDSQKALYWFQKAADMGDRHAQNMVSQMKGVKAKNQQEILNLENPKDREDFKELHEISEYIWEEVQECTGSGFTQSACECELVNDYEEMRDVLAKVIEKHPDWLDKKLRYIEKTEKTGMSISTNLKSYQQKVDNFFMKTCSQE